jgi:uncharacterized protein
MTNQLDETLHKFPGDFTFKVFGLANDAFEAEVLGIMHKYAPNFSDRAIQSRTSEHGKYLALTLTIYAESKDQVDDIYRALSASPLVLMAL